MSACDLGCVWAAKSAGLQRGVRPGCGGLTASEGGIETACRAPPPPHQLRLDAGSSIRPTVAGVTAPPQLRAGDRQSGALDDPIHHCLLDCVRLPD